MKIIRIIYYPFIILCLALTAIGFYDVVSMTTHIIDKYKWFGLGILIYIVLRRLSFFAKNEEWMQTFSHELSHTIVSLLFFRKISAFHAEEKSGFIYHTTGRFGDIFIALAPYCLPLFTYIFLLMRLMSSENSLYIFDIFIGFTTAFHALCFWKETRPYQTDISGQGYTRSYLFIATALFFNASIIILSINKGIVKAFSTIFTEYWHLLNSWWNAIF